MGEIVAILDKFIKRQYITKQTIEEILSISLRGQSNSNPYWVFYEAICSNGPFTQVHYREPGTGATSQARGVTLTVKSEPQVTEPDVRRWYGAGTIEQIIPDAQPEGLITYKYKREAQTLFLTYHGQSYRLSTVSFWR